jgi:hypothetical protein
MLAHWDCGCDTDGGSAALQEFSPGYWHECLQTIVFTIIMAAQHNVKAD